MNMKMLSLLLCLMLCLCLALVACQPPAQDDTDGTTNSEIEDDVTTAKDDTNSTVDTGLVDGPADDPGVNDPFNDETKAPSSASIDLPKVPFA